MIKTADSFACRLQLQLEKSTFDYFDLQQLEKQFPGKISRLPFCLKVLLENSLRQDDGSKERRQEIEALIHWNARQQQRQEISFLPARVVLQDLTGVPALVDFAVMRDAMAKMGGDASKIDTQLPADLVIDHSVQVDHFGSAAAFKHNVQKEFERNRERYTFLRWGQRALDNLRVVPPGTGIVHQVNLEYLAKVVFTQQQEDICWAYPDTLVGTDSHTTMINGLGVLGWGVGGIEAEAAMLGEPISLLIPDVIGFKLKGELAEGATATDLVLTITQMLRDYGVVGKFVEFYGEGLRHLSLADRATISNMAPEQGATCAIFPIDTETLHYLRFTGRDAAHVDLVEAYYKAQGMMHTPASAAADYSEHLELDLKEVVASLSGPRRPQDRFPLTQAKTNFRKELDNFLQLQSQTDKNPVVELQLPETKENCQLKHGSVVISAITSCTNTSNPAVMIAAGLLAKKAVERGLQRPPWVKSSLAPGSKVVTDYLNDSGLTPYLEKLGYNLVGYGCTTCIGNSGPLSTEIAQAIQQHNLVACSVLSGNRNFEGRINPHTRFNYLASPPLVVAYGLAGRMDIDWQQEPVGNDKNGKPAYLRDIWPTQAEVQRSIDACVKTEMFQQQYSKVFEGEATWQSLPVPKGSRYDWNETSTYIKAPTFFDAMPPSAAPLQPIMGMRLLALLGDSVTTDHISPAGAIPKDSPAGRYLVEHGVPQTDFNSFGARRGNHEVMVRGTFGNIRLRNQLVPGVEGGYTVHPENKKPLPIYDAAMKYAQSKTPLIVIAGKEYGSGSSRDWAAKGTRLLGIRCVLAESFERIHRSNLIGMGVLPLQFTVGSTAKSLDLKGSESFDLVDLNDALKPKQKLTLQITRQDGQQQEFAVIARIDTATELTYYRHGGILHYVLRSMLQH